MKLRHKLFCIFTAGYITGEIAGRLHSWCAYFVVGVGVCILWTMEYLLFTEGR